MTESESISEEVLLQQWASGEHQAAAALFDRYVVRLRALVRSRLSRKLARRLDPEDVVLSAWRSFFVGAARRRFAVPEEGDLWPLLVTLTLRKLARQSARQQTESRNPDHEASMPDSAAAELLLARDPSPTEAAFLADEIESLMQTLQPADRDVLVLLLQGHSQKDVASILDCTDRTIRRASQRIRTVIAERSPAGSGELPATEATPESSPHAPQQLEGQPPTPGEWDAESQIPFSRLVLQEMIGAGGVGKVYRGLLGSSEQTVAVKFLRKRFWNDPRAVTSLLREFQLVSQLDHPGIVRHHGWGRTGTGSLFLVMEWIDGISLREWMSSVPPICEVLAAIRQVAEALTAVHAAGIVHGDLTPGNVLRGRDGRIVLADFGFARRPDTPVEGCEGGTPGFLAPEQVSDAFGPLTAQTDVYGLGGLLYALLTGAPPFNGSDVPLVLADVVSSRPPKHPAQRRGGVSDNLSELALWCLQKEQADRPRAVDEVLAHLDRLRTSSC